MAGRPKGTPKTGGRKKGTPNKISSALKEAILVAAEQAGGEQGIVGYLRVQALANPAAFMSLLGKVLPMTIADTGKDEETRWVVTTRVVWPEDKDGNIIKPSWWEDEEMGRRMRSRSRAAQGRSAAADAMNA
ncbi:MAG: hypothetical protein WA728_01455 [Xanthobacteraceae bacterium]